MESTGPPYSVFTTKEKRFIILLTATAGFFSPLSANIYFPALNSLAADLHVSETLINLTLTSYMIFQGIAPTFVGDLADAAGRRPAYLIGFVIYIGACIGIALQNSFAALFILRCLQSAGSSGTVALGSGVVADISTSAERGTYMGWATAGILVGPAIGPVCCPPQQSPAFVTDDDDRRTDHRRPSRTIFGVACHLLVPRHRGLRLSRPIHHLLPRNRP